MEEEEGEVEEVEEVGQSLASPLLIEPFHQVAPLSLVSAYPEAA